MPLKETIAWVIMVIAIIVVGYLFYTSYLKQILVDRHYKKLLNLGLSKTQINNYYAKHNFKVRALKIYKNKLMKEAKKNGRKGKSGIFGRSTSTETTREGDSEKDN